LADFFPPYGGRMVVRMVSYSPHTWGNPFPPPPPPPTGVALNLLVLSKDDICKREIQKIRKQRM
jgi:hypothetical protein